MLLLACLPCRGFADIRADVDALTRDAADRSAGSATAARNADYFALELARRTSEHVDRQSFPLVLPVVERCSAVECVKTADGFSPVSPIASVPIAPLLPSGGQAAAIAPEFATAELLYAGDGSLENLRGHEIAHRIVALNVSSPPTAWQTAASLGASAILFLGDPQTHNTDLLNKSTSVPVGIPRFYCDDPASVVRIRTGQIAALRLDIHITWQEQPLDNILCLIPGRQRDASHDARWTNQLIILQCPYDGVSEIMTRAPGTTQALNAAILLDLAEKIAAAPNRCSVLIAFTAGDQWNLRGSRTLLDLLNREVKDPARAVAILEKQIADVEGRRGTANMILHDLAAFKTGDFSGLVHVPTRDAMENQLLREGSVVEDQLQHARVTSAAGAVGLLESQKENLLAAINFLHLSDHRASATSHTTPLKDAAGRLLPAWQLEASRLERLCDELRPCPKIRAMLGTRTPTLWLSLAHHRKRPVRILLPQLLVPRVRCRRIDVFFRASLSPLPTPQ